MRTMDDSIGSVIDSSWRGDVSGTPLFKLTSKLKNLKAVLKSWNKSVFGHIKYSISILRGENNLQLLSQSSFIL